MNEEEVRVTSDGCEPAAEEAGTAKGGALEACGYEVAADEPGGVFSMRLSTPFEGAFVEAAVYLKGETGRDWMFFCHVRNCRGIGWRISGAFGDCGRSVSKAALRRMALEMRRAYNRRGQKIRKRSIARAIARKAAEMREGAE